MKTNWVKYKTRFPVKGLSLKTKQLVNRERSAKKDVKNED
jgi:hypothetical protein